MEINKCTSAVNAYSKLENNYKSTKKENAAGASVKNVDKAEFSAAARTNSINSVKASIKKNVDSSASSDRIAVLKSMVADGSYNVSAEKVACVIMEG